MFNKKRNIETRIYNNLYHFFDNMLIIFDVNTFIKKIKKFNTIIIVYEYVDDFVTFNFHV